VAAKIERRADGHSLIRVDGRFGAVDGCEKSPLAPEDLKKKKTTCKSPDWDSIP
jgi:hypothetical protein